MWLFCVSHIVAGQLSDTSKLIVAKESAPDKVGGLPCSSIDRHWVLKK